MKKNNHIRKIEILISAVHPLRYLLLYFAVMLIYALVYVFVVPHGFYAPYAKFEPNTEVDRNMLAGTLTQAIQRSLDAQAKPDFKVDLWQLDFGSATVDSVAVSDPGLASFRLRVNAKGFDTNTGNSQVAWTASVQVAEQPSSETLGDSEHAVIYRRPEITPSRNASPFYSYSDQITRLMFQIKQNDLGLAEPMLALNVAEDKQLRAYIAAANGDPSEFTSILSQIGRMIYLSAVVITTLGLGDIVTYYTGGEEHLSPSKQSWALA